MQRNKLEYFKRYGSTNKTNKNGNVVLCMCTVLVDNNDDNEQITMLQRYSDVTAFGDIIHWSWTYGIFVQP